MNINVNGEEMSQEPDALQGMSTQERDVLLLSLLEEKGKRVDPYKWQKAYDKRMRENEEYRKKKSASTVAWQTRKYREDEEYREKIRARQRKYYAAKKASQMNVDDPRESI